MSMAAGAGVGAPLRVGAVVSRSFGVFFAGFWKFTLLMVAPYAVGFVYGFANGFANGFAHALGASSSGAPRVGLVILALVAQVAVYAIVQGACIYGAYQIMRRAPFRLGRSIAVGSGRAASLYFASLLSGLLVALASLLLVIPGIIFFCMFFAALPVCVIERMGPVACLGRSRALTAGYRWPIFGLLLLVLVLIFGGLFVFALVMGGSAALLQGAQTGQSGIGWTLIVGLVGVIAFLAAQAWGIVLTVVVYHDLRVAKEGVDIAQLANVFA